MELDRDGATGTVQLGIVDGGGETVTITERDAGTTASEIRRFYRILTQ